MTASDDPAITNEVEQARQEAVNALQVFADALGDSADDASKTTVLGLAEFLKGAAAFGSAVEQLDLSPEQRELVSAQAGLTVSSGSAVRSAVSEARVRIAGIVATTDPASAFAHGGIHITGTAFGVAVATTVAAGSVSTTDGDERAVTVAEFMEAQAEIYEFMGKVASTPDSGNLLLVLQTILQFLQLLAMIFPLVHS